MTRAIVLAVLATACAAVGCAPRPKAAACAPESDAELCSRESAECGALKVTDRCGTARALDCGTCPERLVCGLEQANRCTCNEESDADPCMRVGAECGRIRTVGPCGVLREVDCGTCASPSTCGGGGVANVCGCLPVTNTELCERAGRHCGLLDVDVCGQPRHVDCGGCGADWACVEDAAGGCGCEQSIDVCTRLDAECGTVAVPNACGASQQVTCGGCPQGRECGAWGVANVCGCPTESADALCYRARVDCGVAYVMDSCNIDRAVDCGGCSTGWACGAGGVDGKCAPLTCVGDRWCWENPLPQGETLNAVSGYMGLGWAVGERGTILHWDGEAWRVQASPTTASLRSIWGKGNGVEAWAVGADAAGNGVIVGNQGIGWRVEAAGAMPPLNGVDASGPGGDVWIVGDRGTKLKLQRQPHQWVQQGTELQDLKAVAALSDGHVFVGGTNGVQIKGPSGWSQLPLYVPNTDWIWARSIDDYWFASSTGFCHVTGPDPFHQHSCRSPQAPYQDDRYLSPRAYRVDNFATTTWVSYTYEHAPRSVGELPRLDSVILEHDAEDYETTAFQASDGRVVRGLWGWLGDVWAVGENGLIMHFDGTRWNAPNGLSMGDLRTIAIAGGELWAGGRGQTLLHSTGNGWTKVGRPPGVWDDWNLIRDISMTAGGGWAIVTDEDATSYFWSILRLEAGTWQGLRTPNGWRPLAIAAVGANEAWAAGERGALYYCDATQCQARTAPVTTALSAMSAASASDIWAGGEAGHLLHYDGSAWTEVASPAGGNAIEAIWAADAQNVWMLVSNSAARKSEVHHYTGTAWSKEIETAPTLRGLCGTSSSDVWSVGSGGRVLQRSAGAWAAVESGTGHDLWRCAANAQAVWVAGDGGAILKRTRQ